MARKKREIQKRKKQLDQGADSIQQEQATKTDTGPSESAGDGRAEARKAGRTKQQGVARAGQEGTSGTDSGPEARDTWLSRNKENLLLCLLVVYVLLLGLGTAGELFEIEWILNLRLFR